MDKKGPPSHGIQEHDIQHIKLLKDTDFNVVGPLLAQCPIRTLGPEEVLLGPDTPHAHMYFLLEGQLHVHLQLDDSPVSALQAGESVGELAPLDGTHRSAYVQAFNPCRLLEVNKEIFWKLLRASNQMSINLLLTLSQRLRGNNTMLVEGRELQEKYKRHAELDNLTGLYNRRWFDEMYGRSFMRSQKEGTPLSLIMLDVDHFKTFNDTYGHQAGDFVLFVLGRVLKARFRPTDLLARYGGEEFAVILPNTNAEGAKLAAERVRKALEKTPLETPHGTKLPTVTISLGIAEKTNEHDQASLLRDADRALYRAKAAGRNCSSF